MGVLLMNRPVSAVTGINQKINFQGRLFNAQGATVPDGNYNIQFKIYQDGAGTTAGNPGGSLEWTEEWLNDDGNGVQIKNGYMSVELGTVTAFGSSVDWNQDTLWLSMNIGNTNGTCTPFSSCGGDGEMVPMKRLSSAVYALNAGQLGGLTSAQFLQLAQGVQTDASTNTTSIFLNKTNGGNFLQLQSSGTDVFTLSNSGDILFGANADHTISVGTAAASTAGKLLTISAGGGGSGTGSVGGDLVLQGGAAGGTNANGGNVTINAGAKTGSGTDGTVSIGTSNTSAITLGQDTTLAAGKSLTLTGGNTASRPASPTEGMMYYDTTTDQLLTYANGKWQGDRSTSTKIVAASNSSQAIKDAADYVADGTADESEINTALTAASGGKVYLAEGTYVAAATILIPNNTTLAGAGRGTLIEMADIDTTDNLIENSDTSTGTGIVIQNLRLDGRKDLNTAGTQYGIFLDGMGNGSGGSARQGAQVTQVWVNNFNSRGISLAGSANNSITDSTFQNNSGYNIALSGSSEQNNITGNNVQGSTAYGISIGSSSYNTIASNTISTNANGGIVLQSGSTNNVVSNNNLRNNGGSGANDAINVNDSDSNSITGNRITDTAGSGYAINISDAASDSNYLSNNYFTGTGATTLNNAGTGTIFGGQTSTSGNYIVQPAGTIELQANTNVTGSLSASTSVLTPTVDTASAGTLTIGGTNATAITMADNTTVTANLTVTNAGNVAFERGTDFSTTGSSDNVNFGSGALFRLTGASAQTITGIAGGANGRIITLVNAASQAATIANNSGSSSAANRIITGSGANISLVAGSSLSLVYDSGDSVWRVVGASGSTASYIELQGSTPGTAQTGNFNITGTGIAATLQGGTSVLTPLLDTVSAGTLSIGTATATAITIGDTGVTTTVTGGLAVTGTTALNDDVTIGAGKSLRITGGNTGSRPGSPSEGTVYFDTDTDRLITYANGKWQADRTDAVLVAASNSSQADKDAADYVADGNTGSANDGDQIQINSALTAGAGKKVVLLAGTYVADATISVPNNTTLAGVGRGTIVEFADIDATDELIVNSDTSTGTGVVIRDMKLDGRKDLNTAGQQSGIYFNGMGSGNRDGGMILNLLIEDFGGGSGIFFESTQNTLVENNEVESSSYGINPWTGSTKNTFTGNSVHGNEYGFAVGSSSSYNTISSNSIFDNTTRGIRIEGSSNYTAITGNTITGNGGESIDIDTSAHTTITGNTIYQGGSGILLTGATYATVSGNSVSGTSSYGIALLSSANNNNITGNNLRDNGGSTTNNAIYLNASDSNSITSNTITDSAASSTNYAINISNNTSDTNYLGGNTLGTGSVNDAGTGTIYGGQLNSSNAFNIQASGGINLQSNTSVTGTLSATTSLQAPLLDTASATALNIGTTNATSINLNKDTNLVGNLTFDSGANRTLSIGTSAASTAGRQLTVAAGTGGSGAGSVGGDLVLQGGAAGGTNANGGNIYLDAGAKTGAGVDGSIYLGSTRATTIQIGNTSLASGTQTINIGTNNTSGGTTNVTIGNGSSATAGTTTVQAKDGITLATNGVTRATFNNANSVYFGNGVTAAAPNNFTISGTGSSTTAVAGGSLTIQGGNATVGSANGGNLTLTGGTGSGTGVKGLVVIDTPTFTTASSQNCAGADCTITQANVDSNGAVIVTFSSTGLEAAIPDPTQTTAGRIVYVTAANGSSDFTLCLNDVTAGGSYDGTCNTTTGNSIAMRANTTATLIWSGSDWTAAGASSSTDLQAAYNNTLTSAGAAELVVSSSANANGLTIRDSSTSPVNGTLLEVQNSAAATLFSVNSNVTEYASNAGAESTFSASNWVALGSSTVTRTTTASNVATGQAAAQVATTAAASDGVKNVLSTSLTANQNYNVSFSAKLSSGTFTDMGVYYSIDGSANSVTCTTGQAIKTKVWTKVNCAFTAPSSGITANNSINIRQVAGSSRTFYIDNLSVTIAADYNYATDGTVNDDGNFATNWTAVGTSSVTHNTSDGQEASDSAQAAAGTTAGNGVKNVLSINPLPSTLYRVSVYAKLSSGSAFTDFTVRYTPDNGTNFVDCVDYNTQTVTTTEWTQITCYVETAGTTVTSPRVHFVQTAAPGVARTFLVDTFSMTLSSASTPNVQIGGGSSGGPTTLFTLDRGASAPIAANNDALLGSMYYDTTLGKLQCYEADGWGACGSSPDNIITISPEYTNAVLHGTGIGTMNSDICSDDLNINDGSSGQATICGNDETYNFYKWTSPQSSAQTYSIYVTYQLPGTFKDFASGDTSLMGRTDSSNSTVNYQVYRNNSSTGLTACGSTVSVSTGSQSSWQTGVAAGAADPSTCSFAAGDSIVFKINVTASSNANAYVGNLNFTFSNR